jgi:hypothetical protein
MLRGFSPKYADGVANHLAFLVQGTVTRCNVNFKGTQLPIREIFD